MKYYLLFINLYIVCIPLQAQDNYEIQVYGSETVEKGKTMVELHSNYTLNGTKDKIDGMLPTHHILHETLEITHGFTSWFEVGFYFFSAIGSGKRSSFVGSHIRPRISAPVKWHWPIGVSFSAEYGLQKSAYSPNTSTLELRPIMDKKWKDFYLAFNPVFGKSLKGPDENRGFIFSPNIKSSYDINKIVALGIEYYGSTGPVFRFDSFDNQQHQVFIVTDLNLNPAWEFNAGIGYGLTKSTDKVILKCIIGRKI